MRIGSAARSVTGAQFCGVQLTWVDAQDQPVGTAGIGGPEGAATASAESVHEFSPDNGGSSAKPVFLRIVREDTEGCPPVGLTLTLQ